MYRTTAPQSYFIMKEFILEHGMVQAHPQLIPPHSQQRAQVYFRNTAFFSFACPSSSIKVAVGVLALRGDSRAVKGGLSLT